MRVGDIAQDVPRDDNGKMTGIDMVELDTGRRIAINWPTKENRENKTCSLNTNALAECTESLCRATLKRVNLIVPEYFGEQERKCQNLNDEILAAIAEDIPLLIAVPQFALELWQERSGEMGKTVAYDLHTFHHWWASVRV